MFLDKFITCFVGEEEIGGIYYMFCSSFFYEFFGILLLAKAFFMAVVGRSSRFPLEC